MTPGDHPTYRSLNPVKSFDPDKGTWGAVELAARYSELRIDADSFTAGVTSGKSSAEKTRELTLGANWYFNDYIKLQLDYSFTKFGAADGGTELPTEHLIATRFQVSI